MLKNIAKSCPPPKKRNHALNKFLEQIVKQTKNKAFTLAEVLITLGIIGVVAALTIPTLIAKYQNQVYVNKLKKVISTLENGVRQSAADEGVNIEKSTLFSLFSVYSTNPEKIASKKLDILKKYFKDVDYDENIHEKTTKTSNVKKMYGTINLMDGSTINYGGKFGENTSLSIDVNGDAGPNKYGRDYFEVLFDEHGIIRDENDCLADFIDEYKYSAEYDTYFAALYAKSCGRCESTLKYNKNYDGCYLYRIQSDGWQMKY